MLTLLVRLRDTRPSLAQVEKKRKGRKKTPKCRPLVSESGLDSN